MKIASAETRIQQPGDHTFHCGLKLTVCDAVNYSRHMAEVIQSATFAGWLLGLRDRNAAARVVRRIERLAMGNPGDHHGVGGGVMEMRLTYGPGYRVYYRHEGDTLVVLLAGGDKSTQPADIAKARAVAAGRDKGDGRDVQSL